MTVYTKADVKPYLSMVTTDNDALIDLVIAEAEAMVVQRCGPLVSTSLTKRVFTDSDELVLPVIPALSITSVTGVETAATYALEANDTNLRAGIIDLDGASEDAYDVVYTAGWADVKANVPADLRRAVIEMCRYLWRPQRGTGSRQGSGDNMDSLRMAEMLMGPYMLPGFA